MTSVTTRLPPHRAMIKKKDEARLEWTAQLPAYEAAGKHMLAFSQNVSGGGGMAMEFGHADIDSFLHYYRERLKRPNQRMCYERLLGGRRCRPFYDLEFQYSTQAVTAVMDAGAPPLATEPGAAAAAAAAAAAVPDEEARFDAFRTLLKAWYKRTHGVKLTDDMLTVVDSSSRQLDKWSRHVHVSHGGVVFATIDEHKRDTAAFLAWLDSLRTQKQGAPATEHDVDLLPGLARLLRVWHKSDKGGQLTERWLVDPSVYIENCMRMLGSCKMGGEQVPGTQQKVVRTLRMWEYRGEPVTGPDASRLDKYEWFEACLIMYAPPLGPVDAESDGSTWHTLAPRGCAATSGTGLKRGKRLLPVTTCDLGASVTADAATTRLGDASTRTGLPLPPAATCVGMEPSKAAVVDDDDEERLKEVLRLELAKTLGAGLELVDLKYDADRNVWSAACKAQTAHCPEPVLSATPLHQRGFVHHSNRVLVSLSRRQLRVCCTSTHHSDGGKYQAVIDTTDAWRAQFWPQATEPASAAAPDQSESRPKGSPSPPLATVSPETGSPLRPLVSDALDELVRQQVWELVDKYNEDARAEEERLGNMAQGAGDAGDVDGAHDDDSGQAAEPVGGAGTPDAMDVDAPPPPPPRRRGRPPKRKQQQQQQPSRQRKQPRQPRPDPPEAAAEWPRVQTAIVRALNDIWCEILNGAVPTIMCYESRALGVHELERRAREQQSVTRSSRQESDPATRTGSSSSLRRVMWVARRLGDFCQSTPARDVVHVRVWNLDDAKWTTRKYSLGTIWLESRERRLKRGVVFVPYTLTPPPPAAIEHDFNLFTGFAVTHQQAAAYAAARPDTWLAETAPFTEHLLRVWCSGDRALYEYVLGLMGSIVQRPTTRQKVAVFLRGGCGAGKGIVISEFLMRILGPDLWLDVRNMETVTSRFNSGLRTCLLAYLDEAAFAGNHQVSQAVKKLITDEHHRVEEKYKDSVLVESFVNVFASTNDERSVMAQGKERRCLCLKVDDTWAGPPTSADRRAYWSRLLAVPIEAVAHLLYTLDLAPFDASPLPETDELRTQQRHSMTGVRRFLYDLLADDDEYRRTCHDGTKSLRVDKDDLHRRYVEHETKTLSQYQRSDVKTKDDFFKSLRELLADLPSGDHSTPSSDPSKKVSLFREVRHGSGVRRRYILFPPLADGRAAFDRAMGVCDPSHSFFDQSEVTADSSDTDWDEEACRE